MGLMPAHRAIELRISLLVSLCAPVSVFQSDTSRWAMWLRLYGLLQGVPTSIALPTCRLFLPNVSRRLSLA